MIFLSTKALRLTPRGTSDQLFKPKPQRNPLFRYIVPCLILSALTGAEAQAQQASPTPPPTDESAAAGVNAPDFQNIRIGTMVPYDQAMGVLQQRVAGKKVIDVSSFLPKEKPSPTPTPVANSRHKTIQALQKRLSSGTKAIPPAEQTVEAIKSKITPPQEVDLADFYPEPKPAPISLSASVAKSGLTGSLLSYDQVKKLTQQKAPPPKTSSAASAPKATQTEGAAK